MSRRWHGNEIGIDFYGCLQNHFDHVSLPNLYVPRNYNLRGELHGWCERPYVKKIDGQIATSKRFHQLTDGDGTAGTDANLRRLIVPALATWDAAASADLPPA